MMGVSLPPPQASKPMASSETVLPHPGGICQLTRQGGALRVWIKTGGSLTALAAVPDDAPPGGTAPPTTSMW
jgi:hypothetical protein